MSETLKYYSFDSALSRNAVFNFIVGARGVGKTYGAKKLVIKKFLKNGDQFIYLRRYSTELKTIHTFFADIANEFPGVQFKVHGNTAQVKTEKNGNWKVAGYFLALSKAQSQKSVAFPDVKTIIYDEFIIDKGAIHYLPQEARAFNDFFSTVDRWKDKTRVLFLANSVSIMNPYFIEFNIRPQEGQEWIVSHNGFVCTHLVQAREFATGVFKTRFGQFIKDSEYADYSVNSEFQDNNDALIGKKTPEAKYHATIETKTGMFSLWIDVAQMNYYVQEKRPKQEIIWTMLPDRMEDGKILVSYTDKTLQYLRSAFGRGKVLFSSPQARNAFVGVFSR